MIKKMLPETPGYKLLTINYQLHLERQTYCEMEGEIAV